MAAAIPKLERRIADLDAFDPASIQRRGDPRITSLETKIQDTLTEILGHETAEYQRFEPYELDTRGYTVGRPLPLRAT
jgi:hypothetical protein